MTRSEQQRANRLYYLGIGKCPRCGGANKVVESRVLCVECQQKHDDEQVERRNRWKEQGLCVRCGRECAPGRKQCQQCLDSRNIKQTSAAASKRWRDKNRMLGMCTVCGRTWAEPGRTKCKSCMRKHRAQNDKYDPNREKAKARRAARVEAGLCIDCGQPSDGKQRCPECREKQHDRTRKYQITKKIERQAERARRANV